MKLAAAIAALVRRVRRDTPLLRNLAGVYGALVVGNAVTLTLVSYLARVLGPASWGMVLMAQGLAAWIGLAHTYGFGLAGTRAVAQRRDAASDLARLAAAILVSQALLAAASVPLLMLVPWLWPPFRHHLALVVAAWCLSLANALTPAWYYQGRERMVPLSAVQVTAALLALGLTLALVHGPAEMARVLWLQAGAAGAGSLWLLARMARELRLPVPRAREVRAALRLGGGLFVYRLATSLYTTANVLLLGIFLPAAAVALFGSAERICKAIARLIVAFTPVLLSRVSHGVGRDPAAARRIARASLAVTAVLGLSLAAATAVLAPWIVHLVLGRGYGDAVPLVRALAPLIVIVPLGGVLGLQWMLPLGHDRAFLAVVLGAGLLNLAGVLTLVPRFGAAGMAVAVVGAETAVMVGMWLALARRGAGLWRPAPDAERVPG